VVHALGRESQAPHLCREIVDEQAAHDDAERFGVRWKAVHEFSVASEVGDRAGSPVEIGYLAHEPEGTEIDD